jgi:hypothetical protein
MACMTMTVDLNTERFVPYTSQDELLALQKMFPTCVEMGGADFGVVMSASYARSIRLKGSYGRGAPLKPLIRGT